MRHTQPRLQPDTSGKDVSRKKRGGCPDGAWLRVSRVGSWERTRRSADLPSDPMTLTYRDQQARPRSGKQARMQGGKQLSGGAQGMTPGSCRFRSGPRQSVPCEERPGKKTVGSSVRSARWMEPKRPKGSDEGWSPDLLCTGMDRSSHDDKHKHKHLRPALRSAHETCSRPVDPPAHHSEPHTGTLATLHWSTTRESLMADHTTNPPRSISSTHHQGGDVVAHPGHHAAPLTRRTADTRTSTHPPDCTHSTSTPRTDIHRNAEGRDPGPIYQGVGSALMQHAWWRDVEGACLCVCIGC